MKEYGFKVRDYMVGGDTFRFAVWEHPLQKDPVFRDDMYFWIRNIVKPMSVVIDIGTHMGVETVMYGLAAGRYGKVYGFEPNPHVIRCLQHTASINGKFNIEALNYAITKKAGEYTFHYSDDAFCNGGFATETEAGVGALGHVHPLTVQGVNLIEWMTEYAPEDVAKIGFIKIDTEGYDLAVLESIEKMIMGVRPIIQTELFLMLSEEEIRKQLAFFDRTNYVTYFMPDEKAMAIGCCDIFALKDKGITAKDAPRMKRVAHGGNIISLPKERLHV